MTNNVTFWTGKQGKRFAEILGIEAGRLTKQASVVIEANALAVARIEIALTPDELRRIVAMLTEDDPSADLVEVNTFGDPEPVYVKAS